jgi:hypothetical protein
VREKDLPQQAPRPHPTLCALIATGDFEDYWRFHLRREHERIHHAKYRETYVLAA